MKIENRTFIITGGCNGLGLATATILLSSGANIAAFDLFLDTPGIKELQTKYSSSRLSVYKVDVTKSSEVKAAFQKVVTAYGEISGIVNSAGILTVGPLYHRKEKYEMSEKLFNKTLQVNVVGTFIACQTYIKLYVKEKWSSGVIINVASIAGVEGQQGQIAYAASKAAIMGMTMPISREVGHRGMRIVGIMPGIFDTNMSKGMPSKLGTAIFANSALKRPGRPDEFASFVKTIIENGYLTGSNLRLDGGTRLPML